MIDRERMLNQFLTLIRIDSESKKEGKIGEYLVDKLKSLGLEVKTDDAATKTSGQFGNIIGVLRGKASERPSILVNAHMDTVTPGEGIEAVVEGDIIKSKSDTILGGDDKSGVTAILELLQCIKEDNIITGDVEVVITVCEEIGLLGAKYFNPELIKSTFGFSLDATDPDKVVVKAPAANTINFKVHGLAAHAGMAPEQGINAIAVASQAISKMKLGRIDEETTASLGIIKGGIARNIVPNLVEINGEARSHDLEKLEKQTNHMKKCFESVVDDFTIDSDGKKHQASFEADIKREYNPINLANSTNPVRLALEAGKILGRQISTIAAGGGSDANIFGEKGIQVAVIGTGMNKVHTKDEYLIVPDMVKSAELLLKIVEINK